MALRRKQDTAPTVEERIAGAAAQAGAALSVFRLAAADLVTAAEEQAELAAVRIAQADDLRDQADDLDYEADALDIASQENLAAADRINNLFA